MGRHGITNTVRRWREAAGLSQGDLAAQAGTSRQTLNAVEAGRAVPGTALALRLAAALGCTVEDLFQAADRPPDVPADLAAPLPDTGEPVRVRLAAAGHALIAIPLAGPWGAPALLPEADGVVSVRRGGRVRVRLFAPPHPTPDTVVVAGCDPALPLIAARLAQVHPRYRVVWLPAGSRRAVEWLRRGAAQVAGVHLRDPRTAQDNIPFLRRALGGVRATVLGFATWEQGLIVACGNPRGIRGAGDLARRTVTVVNREAGSGARAVLDARLAACGVAPAAVRGYGREAPSHLAVAQAVALGFADAGVGVRAAARAFGLGFVPLQRERYDLVVRADVAESAAVRAFLDTMRAEAVRAELRAAGDYDLSRLGATLAMLPAAPARPGAVR